MPVVAELASGVSHDFSFGEESIEKGKRKKENWKGDELFQKILIVCHTRSCLAGEVVFAI